MMKSSDNKYQAVKVMRGRIEFRIFPAVKNLQVMEWRINLLRLIAKNPSSNPIQVANDLANSRTELHKHFAKIFTRETIYRKAKKALEYAKKFDSNFYNVDMRANVRAIDSKISRLNKADAKKAEAMQLVLS
jgi:thiamine biosynthesis lipoprotein ApbE